jgi:SAM-dependent methyltransferase
MLLRFLEKRRAAWLGRKIGQLSAGKSSFLNVGAGAGFLEATLLAAGHTVVSIEPAPRAAYRNTLITEPFETAVFAEKFNAIIFSYSLHHGPDPDAALEKAASLLLPKGKIVVLELGIPQLCSSRKHTWPAQALRALLQKHGGSIQEYRYAIFSPLFILSYENNQA